ncbi:MAG: GC-type dockerin domain-anchored protein [Phycisphaerales bacterium]
MSWHFVRTAFLAALLLAGMQGRGIAQSLIGAVPQSGGQSVLHVIDPATGGVLPYLSVPMPAPSTNELYAMTQLPDGRLAATVYRRDGTANNASQLMIIDPVSETSTVLSFGAPLNGLYAEGMDWSPRHNALMVSCASIGNFGTTRLALVNASGTVVSITGAIAGISDMDTVLSDTTRDIFFDLNAAGNPRVKSLTNPLPATAFAAFASPPSLTDWYDGAIHPTTGEVWFSRPVAGVVRLERLVGNAYVAGPEIGGLNQTRGLAWAFLPAKGGAGNPPLVCPNAPATVVSFAVGTGPFVIKWQYIGGPPPANVTAWTDIVAGNNLAPAGTGAPGRFLFSASGQSTTVLTVNRQNVPVGDPGLPHWSHAGVGQFKFRCVIQGSVGAAHITNTTTFQLVSDLNFDGSVNTSDLTTFLGRFGLNAPLGSEAARADFNGDGVVNTADLTFFLGRFGTVCP